MPQRPCLIPVVPEIPDQKHSSPTDMLFYGSCKYGSPSLCWLSCEWNHGPPACLCVGEHWSGSRLNELSSQIDRHAETDRQIDRPNMHDKPWYVYLGMSGVAVMRIFKCKHVNKTCNRKPNWPIHKVPLCCTLCSTRSTRVRCIERIAHSASQQLNGIRPRGCDFTSAKWQATKAQHTQITIFHFLKVLQYNQYRE